MENYTWINFFEELSTKLLNYKGRGNELVSKLENVSKIVQRSNPKINSGVSFDKISQYNVSPDDVDSITAMGAINRGLKDENRIILCEAFKEEFNLTSDVPTDFDAIPVLDLRQAWILAKDNDLWELMEAALHYADNENEQNKQLFIEKYDAVKKRKTSMAYITFGLYWSRPKFYISLDSRNAWYLDDFAPDLSEKYELGNLSGSEYISFCEDLRAKYEQSSTIKSNVDFSYNAYVYSMPFIFQCNPKYYDIEGALQNLDKIVYRVKPKYVNKVKEGTRVYIWVSGNNGGIIAKAKVISKVGNYQDPEGDEYYTDKSLNNDNNESVWIQFTEKRIGNIITRHDILNHPVLKNLSILKMAQGTNFPISLEEAKAIDDIFDGKYIPSETTINPDEVIPALPDTGIDNMRYWVYAPGSNAEKWEEYYKKGIMGIGWGEIGDLTHYSSKSEMKEAMKEVFDYSKSYKMAALATWNFANVMKPGDVIFVKKGIYKIVGRGIVESDYYYEENDDDYRHFRRVNWTDKGEWNYPGQSAMKTLTNITKYKDTVDQLKSLFEDENDEETEIEYPAYDEEQFLKEVYLSEESYHTLVDLVREKKNIILQGAPGVGKTFIAKRLAYSMIGSINQERVMMVQFHQSYSYEDFIEGLRPSRTGNGFEIRTGTFLDFCDRAREDMENDYFFIIDEINRGNLSKIFGELFMLIENDKRGNELQLLYSGNLFSVPDNVYIIGMMNTADRSLALLDYALRRRFSFYEIKPGFDTDGFLEYKDSLNSAKFNKLIERIERLNEAIKEDETLGEGFCIGHSYFCNITEATDKKLSSIVEFEIIPLLKEYWFDEPSKVREWADSLRSAIQ